MSDHTTAHPPQERVAPAIGLLVVVIAASSLLDDTGVLEHPWWVSLAIGLAAFAVLLVARTVAELLRPRDPTS